MTAGPAFGSAKSGEYFMTSECQSGSRALYHSGGREQKRDDQENGSDLCRTATSSSSPAASRVSGAAAQAFGGNHRQKSTGAVIEQSQACGL
jgi:hypothetical protein